MGLFNYIKVEQDLPLNEELKALNIDFKKEEFQTKELEESALTTYIIRDYKLFELRITGRWEDNPDYVKDNAKFGEFFNKNLWVEDKKEEIFREDYTGTFTFGAYVSGETKESYDYFPDWKCVVVKGLVIELSLVEPLDRHSSKDRIDQQIEWDKELETHKNKMKCPVYKFYYNYYVQPLDRFGWYVSRKLYYVTRLIEWIRFPAIRKVVTFLTPR